MVFVLRKLGLSFEDDYGGEWPVLMCEGLCRGILFGQRPGWPQQIGERE